MAYLPHTSVHQFPVIQGHDPFIKESDLMGFVPRVPHRWVQLSSVGSSPSGRYGHSTVTYGRHIYLFGGFNSDEGTLNDMYRLNVDALKWTPVIYASVAVPSPRFYHSAVVLDRYMYIFGGLQVSSEGGAQGTTFNDFWRFDLVHHTWTPVVTEGSVPFGRHNHVAVLHTIEPTASSSGGELELTDDERKSEGGRSDGGRSDSGMFYPELGRPSSPRAGARADVYEGSARAGGGSPHTAPTYMYLFGGYGQDAQIMHRLCMRTYTWEAFDSPGLAVNLRAHTVVLHEGVFYAFGGRQGKAFVNVLMRLYPLDANPRWQRIAAKGEAPSERFGHTCVVSGGHMFVFGGYAKDGICGDLHRLTFATGNWTMMPAHVDGPSRRYYHSALVHGHDMFVFGGYSDDGFDKKKAFKNDLLRMWLDPVIVPEGTLGSELYRALITLAGPEWSDLLLVSTDRSHTVHRVIMAARSEVFKSLITEAWRAGGSVVLTFIDGGIAVSLPSSPASPVSVIPYPVSVQALPSSAFALSTGGGWDDGEVGGGGGAVVGGGMVGGGTGGGGGGGMTRPASRAGTSSSLSSSLGGASGSAAGPLSWQPLTSPSLPSSPPPPLPLQSIPSGSATSLSPPSTTLTSPGSSGISSLSPTTQPQQSLALGSSLVLAFPSIPSDVMAALIHYMYSDTLPLLEPAVIVALIPLAGKLGLPRLDVLCSDKLRETVTISNVASILIHAHDCCAPLIKAYCMDYILDNLQLVRSQTSFVDLKNRPALLLEVTEAVADKVSRVQSPE